ncbi:hypothetical protein [Sediminitomix flava]|uniref:Uncharacterized protein n=1 Tax=Sediminitomix flava TaxID=379075 RepID=A0A315YWR5_SEDFL|nr:hypothetical protein [Sediminitomix flava]PWJ33500.1 hypothetical protein BC781_1132 [Sediminitomix flava]
MKTVFLTFLIVFSIFQASDEKKNELFSIAVQSESTFSYFVVCKIRDLNTGNVKEICTTADFLKGAIHREFNLDYSDKSLSESRKLLLESNRFFEFKNVDALLNVRFYDYPTDKLDSVSMLYDLSNLSTEILKQDEWNVRTSSDEEMKLLAHLLFNEGILTGEYDCFGGVLHYFKDKEKFK